MSQDMNMRRADSSARQLAKTEFRKSVVLVAGAGTGKTATLVARVLVWALDQGWELAAEHLGQGSPEDIAARVFDRITAITFTERAAVEMKQRVAEAIEKLVSQVEVIGLVASDLPPAARLDLRARALLVEIDRLHVETIHAFCRRLLATYPLEAGIHPGFEIDADGEGLKGQLDEILGSFLYEAYGEKADADALSLLEQGVGPDKIAEALALLTNSDCPASRLLQDPYPEAELKDLGRKLSEQLQVFFDLIAEKMRGGGGRLKLAIQTVDAIEQAIPSFASATTVEALVTAVHDLDLKGQSSKLKAWAKAGLGKTEARCFDSDKEVAEVRILATSLASSLAAISSWNPQLLRPAFRLFARLLTEVESRMQRLGIVTFADLLRRARMLLASRPDIVERVRGNIDQLLVDEVQDTDPIQYDIVRMLALEGEMRPGLFLVGDPKQTIYSFRNADLAAFEEFLKEVEEQGGLSAELVVNFRSVPTILEEVERVITPIMVMEPGLQPPFQNLLASEKNIKDPGFIQEGRQAVEHWNSWLRNPAVAKFDDKTSADEARRIEAEAIAADMVELHENCGEAYKNMAILMRSTTQQETYLRALRDAGVPYLVEKDKQFYRRREIIDATSILVATLDPLNHLALLGLLRSTAVGLPDAAILPLWRRQFPAEVTALRHLDPQRIARIDALIDEVAASIDKTSPGLDDMPNWPSLLKFSLRALADLRESHRRLPPDEFLRRLRSAFGFEYQEAARFLGAHRLANLDRFYREVLKCWTDTRRGQEVALRSLLRGIQDEKDEAEGSPGDQSSDAVRIMSIHKSKGLDFHHVYLVAMHQSPGGFGKSDCVKAQGDRFELRLLSATTPGLHELEQHSDRVSDAEAIRTLYVAVTRAAKRLVMTGSWPNPEKDAKELADCKSNMDLLQLRKGHQPSWTVLADENRSAPAETTDGSGVRFFIPDFIGREAMRRWGSGVLLDQMNPYEGLAELREASIAKKERESIRATKTASSHDDQTPPQDWDSDEEGDAARLLSRSRPEDRAAFGTLIHRLLETWPLSQPLGEYLKERAENLEAWLDGESLSRLGPALQESLLALSKSKTMAKLAGLATDGQVLGREMPLLWRDGESVLVGTVDMLYQDADTRDLVVVDFKTDRIEGDTAAKTEFYRSQGLAYVEAVQAAFAGEKKTVRLELWFLDADRIERLQMA